MKLTAIGAILAVLTACSTPEEREQEDIMARIEQTAKLPSGAHSLNEYARFYSSGGRNQVVGVYALPSVVDKLASQECSEITGLDTPMRNVPCVLPKVAKAKAGERLWIDRTGDLPFELVAGCEIITLAYDLRAQRFEELGCVGHRPGLHRPY